MSDLLSQAEIDALLNGMGGGDLDVGDAEDEDTSVYSENAVEEMEERGIVKPYDLANQERIVRGRMPTLEMINERFARLLRVSIFNFLRRASEIFISSIQIKKFSDFAQGLLGSLVAVAFLKMRHLKVKNLRRLKCASYF